MRVNVSVLIRELKVVMGYTEKSIMYNWGFNCEFPPDLFFATILLRVVCPDHFFSKIVEENSVSLNFFSKFERDNIINLNM